MKVICKKISRYSIVLFILMSVIGVADQTGFLPVISLNKNSSPIDYSSEAVGAYSKYEASAVLSSDQKLDITDIIRLIGRITISFPAQNSSVTSPKSDSDFCKESVSLIKAERDLRIMLEKESKHQQRLIFILTVLFGVILLVLKSKKIGQKVIKDHENRELSINAIEFFFAALLIAVNNW